MIIFSRFKGRHKREKENDKSKVSCEAGQETVREREKKKSRCKAWCKMDHCAAWLVTFSPLSPLFYTLSLCIAVSLLSPTSPCSLHPRFLIGAPLTVAWHSKALLPSLTLFHGAAEDNNWFENRRQWDTRIIPGSHPPPPLSSTQPARTSLLCILSSTSGPHLSICPFFFLSFVS